METKKIRLVSLLLGLIFIVSNSIGQPPPLIGWPELVDYPTTGMYSVYWYGGADARVGIGTTGPAYRLDVVGDINTSTIYRVGGNQILASSNGNLNVGNNGAGISTGAYNIVIGNNGMNSSNGTGNSILGYNAMAVATGDYNTIFGYSAFTGFGTTASSNNSVFGSYALYNATGTSYNNAFGNYAQYTNTTGVSNNAFGYQALYSNSTGNYNAAFGESALYHNTVSNNSAFGYQALKGNTYASDNVAIGYEALQTQSYANSNTAYSSYNIAVGNGALFSNQPTSTSNGINNVAVGHNALYSNTTGYDNSAMGYQSLYSNTTGPGNSAFGYKAMYACTTGADNNAFGYLALTALTSGAGCTAMGHGALTSMASNNYATAMGYESLLNTTGTGNTGIGTSAGLTNTTGTFNTYLGYGADANGTGYSNSTGIGYAAPVKTSAAGYVVIGNSSVSSIGGYVGWTTYVSDARCKKDVQANVPGLAFIKKLRPVTYHLDMNQIATINKTPDSLRLKESEAAKGKVLYSGFIAQEVEQAAQQLNYNFSGNYIPQDPNDLHGLSYADFVMPLVKAVQEQQNIIDSLSKTNSKRDSTINAMQNQLSQLLNNNAANNATAINSQNVELSSAVVLNQNVPNPFAEQTVITYNVPQNFTSAQILFYDSNGKLIKTVDVKTTGKGQLNVFANDLTSGIYSYSLIIDGKIIDTKKMMKQD